jgi:hypothetical protein
MNIEEKKFVKQNCDRYVANKLNMIKNNPVSSKFML